MLDCANGYQKENREEINEVEPDFRFEGEADKEAGAKAWNSQETEETGEEDRCSEQSRSKQEGFEENDQREDRERQ
jgi:hypothetical protein